LIDQHRQPGEERIENGSRGEVLGVTPAGEVVVEFDVTGRRRTLAGEGLANVRLGYAQHIHRAQGATVTRTLVVTGGWQTSKEPTYVEASRARNGTDWFVNREDLGVEGHDTYRIERLAASMRRSHAQTPSLRAMSGNRATGFESPRDVARSVQATRVRSRVGRRIASSVAIAPAASTCRSRWP
jgi:hypothetical protein